MYHNEDHQELKSDGVIAIPPPFQNKHENKNREKVAHTTRDSWFQTTSSTLSGNIRETIPTTGVPSSWVCSSFVRKLRISDLPLFRGWGLSWHYSQTSFHWKDPSSMLISFTIFSSVCLFIRALGFCHSCRNLQQMVLTLASIWLVGVMDFVSSF